MSDTVTFEFVAHGITFTVEADRRTGRPIVALRPDGSEFRIETIRMGIARLSGFATRYHAAWREAVALSAAGKDGH